MLSRQVQRRMVSERKRSLSVFTTSSSKDKQPPPALPTQPIVPPSPSIVSISAFASESSSTPTIPPSPPKKVRLTQSTTQHNKKATVACRNEITATYVIEMEELKQRGTKFRKIKLFKTIFDRMVKKNNLPPGFTFPYATCTARIKSGNTQVHWNSRNGLGSPLKDVENEIVNLLMSLSQSRYSVTPAKGVNLINSLISGTEHQEKLIQYKKKKGIPGTNEQEHGIIGLDYFRSLIKRN